MKITDVATIKVATSNLNRSSFKIEVLGIQKRQPYSVFYYRIDHPSFSFNQDKKSTDIF
jgi:hypothetical protein